MYKAKHRRHGFPCAIKQIKKSIMEKNEKRQESISNEMKFLRGLKQQSILRSYELLHDSDNYFFVTELAANGDLFNYYCERQEADQDLFQEH